MKKEVVIREHVVLIDCGDEFAVLQRTPNEHGLSGITFSIPTTPCVADLLEQSGIVEVVQYTASGILSFRGKDFYETHLMIEIIIDILEKHVQKNIG